MPELPEVETVCRGLRAALVGRRLVRVTVRRPDLRFAFPERFAERLQGRRVVTIGRRAKYILAELDDGAIWMTHLGMAGRMVLGSGSLNEVGLHEHVTIETDDGQHVRYIDARRFGFMDLFPKAGLDAHPRLAGLGLEPVGADVAPLTGPVLAGLFAGRLAPLKAALLDQRLIAGLGNIYACEALFRARLSPTRIAGTVTGARAARLAEAIRSVLEDAIAAGGSSLRDYVQTSGELGYFQHSWAVYGREGEACPACNCDRRVTGGINRLVQSGRSTFFCVKRQR
ncbi:formamidopyrimidine-DNA glycosylase [Constrictibacter sp. MBR-5]|jgi:formamidopyrimidine-DNA glycosylase|uniref:bifunctional DNA-formamidopyrimidine glycosylase/DNA-(apurinic or apyrimidinic site) lyase n=1 Tax=Constrictibacter sp. MBR-5 TaxID=3156467 RepID=UPI0033949186